jgi:hypothetical protein
MKNTLGTAAIGASLLTAIAAPSVAFGGDGDVRWRTIVGIEDANNVVVGIPGSSQPWSALGGEARVNVNDGTVEFEVRGLVQAGGAQVGTTLNTPLGINGTIICNPNQSNASVINTPVVPLSPQGDAQFDGSFTSSTAGCNTTGIAFLIRNALGGSWIANGAIKVP